jgi:prepilin-type N-terminal cleavage/methylation domain-containing protein
MHNTLKRLQARGGSGFTLIELLVVIAILAILSGVVVFAVGNSTKNAAVAACKTERASLITAFNAAYTSNQVNAGTETYTDYMEGTTIKYFGVPSATTGATRLLTTDVSATDCPAIGQESLQPNP